MLAEVIQARFDVFQVEVVALEVERTYWEQAAIRAEALKHFILGQGLRLLEEEGPGRFAEDLPAAGVDALLVELEFGSRFGIWASTRDVGTLSPIEKWPLLQQLLSVG